jgi:hypothetical protein
MPNIERNIMKKIDLQKYDSSPLYMYTEKDSLNRITVLKELGKENYLVAGRYAGFQNDARVYSKLSNEERTEVEKLLRMGRKDATINFL